MGRKRRRPLSHIFLWTAGGLTVIGIGALIMSKPKNPRASSTGGRRAVETYAINPNEPYGPTFEKSLPPGLPASARQASRYHAALPHVRRVAEGHRLGNVFVATIIELGQGESGHRYGMPAHNFDARLIEGYDANEARRRHLVPDPDGPRRPKATAGKKQKPLITAWGVFQWNRDSGRDSGVAPRDWFAWHWTIDEEVSKPIAYYAKLWKRVRGSGGSELDAARGIRLWHAEPATFKRWLDRGPRIGWGPAWDQVAIARRIDKHLDKAGVLA